MSDGFKRVKVLIETAERSFRGFLFLPEGCGRLSDFLNGYDRQFLCLQDVEIADRGQHWRIGEQHAFIAVSTNAITYVMPMEGE